MELIRESRLVGCTGPPGIGKTTLVRNLSWYMMDRAIFKDGIVVYSCIGSNSIHSFMTNFVLAIINSWGGEGDIAEAEQESEEVDKARKFVNSSLE